MTDLLQTPLHAEHVALGGRLVDFAGWAMPVQYTSILDEHHATRNSAALFDVSHMGRLWFDGPVDEVATSLDRLVTRRVDNLPTGRVRYSLLTDERGAVLDDVLVYRMPAGDDAPETFLLVVNAGNRQKVLEHLKRHADVAPPWRDVTCETAMIAVQGPEAVAAAAPLLSIDLPQLGYYRCTPAMVAGHPGWVSRTGYTGEDGCELIMAADAAADVWRRLLQQPQRPTPAGLGARDTLRLEAAMPLYGHELSESITPFEAGLGMAVDLQRSFVGRDALAAVESPQRARIGLKLLGKRIAREGSPVIRDGEQVGEVTSGSISPTLHHPIAMALVRLDCQTPGARLEVDIRGRLEAAEVTPLPFYRRST